MHRLALFVLLISAANAHANDLSQIAIAGSEVESPLRKAVRAIDRRFVGNEKLIEEAARAILRADVANRGEIIQSDGRPLASFFLAGPADSGKTELARTVARVGYGNDPYIIDVSRPVNEVRAQLGNMKNTRTALVFANAHQATPEALGIIEGVLKTGQFTSDEGSLTKLSGTVVFIEARQIPSAHVPAPFGLVQGTRAFRERAAAASKNVVLGPLASVLRLVDVGAQLAPHGADSITKVLTKSIDVAVASFQGVEAKVSPEVVAHAKALLQRIGGGATTARMFAEGHLKTGMNEFLIERRQRGFRDTHVTIGAHEGKLTFHGNATQATEARPVSFH